MDNIEALKLLLEVEAGENITQVVVWYFLAQCLSSLLTFIGFMLVVWAVYRLILRLAVDHDDRWLCQQATLLRTKTPGGFSDSERRNTLQRIEELVQAELDKEKKTP